MEDVEIALVASRYGYADQPFGIAESNQLDFHSPYGCSKGCAEQYIRDYSRIYDIPTVVMRQSCIYGEHQFGIEDQGWIAWFTIASMFGRPVTIFGDGCQVRDVLYVGDLVDAYLRAAENPDTVRGKIYNVGGGPSSTLSLNELVALLREQLGTSIETISGDWRPGDQRVYISDIRKIDAELGWRPTTDVHAGISRLVDWVKDNRDILARYVVELD